MIVQFFVPGIPKPGGSKTGFYSKNLNQVMIVDASKNMDWKSSIKVFAIQAYSGIPLTIPLILSVIFTMPRPKTHYGTGKNKSQLKQSSPKYPTGKPDALKLCRCLEDALTGILWRDDSQIVEEHIRKGYGEKPGVEIILDSKEG